MKFLNVLLVVTLSMAALDCTAAQRWPNLIERILDRLLAERRNQLNERVITLIEGQRENFATGWPQFGIPPLDPIFIEDAELELDDFGTFNNLNFRIQDADVFGLQQFEIVSLDIRLVRMTCAFHVRFPQLSIVGQHATSGFLGTTRISGAGSMTLAMNNVSVNGTIQITTEGRFLKIESLPLSMRVGSANANLRGFGTFVDPLVNIAMSAALPLWINANDERINEIISESLVPSLNEQLQESSIFQIIVTIIINLLTDIETNDPITLEANADNIL